MPEGHTVHRVAAQLNQYFAGKKPIVDSPQGRFAQESSLLSGQKLIQADAFGKQLLIDYGKLGLIRIHLGIYGKWQFRKLQTSQTEQQPIGQVRLRLATASQLAELRGPTACELITRDEGQLLLNRLGPDPLRADADGVEEHQFISRVSRSNINIARLLMDQSVIAGVGNVYRAELLFRARLSPDLAGSRVPEEVLRAIWRDAVNLLAAGRQTGIMVTRDELLGRVVPVEERNFVYRRTGEACRVCGSKVRMRLEASRKLYWCASCQR